MASMLEVAIIFQPNDTGILDDGSTSPQSTSRKDLLFLKSLSMNIQDLHIYTENTIDKVYNKLISSEDGMKYLSNGTLTRERVEILLNSYGWNTQRLISDFSSHANQVFAVARLDRNMNTQSKQGNAEEEMYCQICSDPMCATLTNEDLIISENDPESLIDSKRSLTCPAGHRYCLDCWRSHLQVQIKENGGYALSCPGRAILIDSFIPYA